MFPKVTLILGGASSGKSAFAESLVKSAGRAAIYLATARAGDTEMAIRIARHRQTRGAEWQTVETALGAAAALEKTPANHVVLLECATMWLSNQMAAGRDMADEQSRLLDGLENCAAPVVVVSNEVGQGGVSANALAREFAQAQGALNIALADIAELVVLVAAGLPLVLKGTLGR